MNIKKRVTERDKRELAKEEYSYICKKMSEGASLEKLLTKKFPNTVISIIRGFDNFSYEPYTEGAYFSKAQAIKARYSIQPNGTLPDSYNIVTGTVEQLESGMIRDPFTGSALDSIDRMMVYESLEESLGKFIGGKNGKS